MLSVDQQSCSIEPHGDDISPQNAALGNAIPDPTPQPQALSTHSINVAQQHRTFQTDGANGETAAHLSSEIAVPKDLQETQIRNESLADAAADDAKSEDSSLRVERVFPIRIQNFGNQSDLKRKRYPHSSPPLLTTTSSSRSIKK
jgi:hypothetical protein